MTLICTREFEINPENYPEGATAEEVIEIDKEGIIEDPFSFIDSAEVKVEVTGKIVEE
jgi:hypothetical protein